MFSCKGHSPQMKDGLWRTDGQKVVDPQKWDSMDETGLGKINRVAVYWFKHRV